MNQKTKEYIMDLLKTDIEVNPDVGFIKDMYYEIESIPVEPNHNTKALHKMIDALEGFKEAYNNVLEAWSEYDINETESIELYPFVTSFDEINVSEWVDSTMKELNEIDYPYIGLYKNDSYYCSDVRVFIQPMQSYSYTRALFIMNSDILNQKWWVDLDIVTSDTKEALEESKKEKYYCSGYSETF